MTDLPELEPDHAELERLARRRRARAVRGIAVLVVVVAAVIFVVQNSQPVKVHLWLVTGHPRLIWVVLVSLVVGIGFGYALGAPERKVRRQRRRQDKQDARRRGRA